MSYEKLESYLGGLVVSPGSVAKSRRALLNPLVEFVRGRQLNDMTATLNFVCVHNSRRSQMCQVWASVAAHRCGVKGIQAVSGGTEVTEFNPRAVAALERAGLIIENPGGENPHYKVRFSDDAPPIECFSKRFDDRSIPAEDFAAVMTCAEAESQCPVVFGARRVSLPYEDPKVADGTDNETALYDARCNQIATEMLWTMQRVATAD